MPAPIARNTEKDVNEFKGDLTATIVHIAELDKGEGAYSVPGHTKSKPRFVKSAVHATQMARQVLREMERGA